MVYPNLELVRLALPRRVYTQSHLDYVVDIFSKTAARSKQIPGYELTFAPKLLRQFTAQLKPITLDANPLATLSEQAKVPTLTNN